MSASSTAPLIDGADIANYGIGAGTDKWFYSTATDGGTRGQSITTGGAAVRLNSITYQVSDGNGAAPVKTYTLRVGKIAGNSFTQVHSETATQNFSWTSGQYMTWTFNNPVLLEPYTTYGIDVGMTGSTSIWQTGIPYIHVTADEYAGGTSYVSGTGGIGTASITASIASDRTFHLDMERPLGPVFAMVAPSPTDNATDVYASREIVMTFSQNVSPGTGNLTVRNLNDNIDTTLAATDSRLTYDQNVVRLNPAGLLDWNKSYAIRFDAGIFLGDAAAPVPAITDDTTWNFTTIASDPLLSALAAIKAHILNTAPLTGFQISAHKTTIDNQRQRFAESTGIIEAVFDLIATYDTAKGPLFVSGFANNTTSFDRNVTTPTSRNSISPENYHWVVYTVMQHAMDLIYTAENLAKYEATLGNYKFGSHTSFPGPCSPPANPANTHSVPINGSFPVTFGRITQMWTSPARKPTGTYLAPGTIATVTVPPALVNAGYKVRVGAHSWDLSTRRPVNRLERATRLFSINATTIKVASPYGGGIYIEVPYRANAGVVNVTVTGGVRSPYFSVKSFHQTTPAEWNIEKTHPAPWADFQSDKFMVQVPGKWIYNHPNPTQLMVDWDASMDAINDLMGFPRIRGKETMYCQTDVIMRSSVHAPGYPAVNVTSNVNSEVSPIGYAGNYLVRGPGSNPPASHIEFHEQGHAYFFPKFGGESESTVNLLQPAMLNRVFNVSFDVAHRSSLGSNNAFRTIDNTAVAWMCVFNFSPREVPMASGESAYQHKGHAKWMDIARIYGWDKLDTFWRSYMEDEANSIPVSGSTDALLLRLCRAVGKDIRPLFHFWGIHPQNPSSLAASIAAENIPADPAIKAKLLHYRTLVPSNNSTFRTFALAWWGKQPSIRGAWEEREHSRQWDTAALYGPGDQQRSQATNPGEIFNENSANDIVNRVDELVALYFPGGLAPTTMSFAAAPAALNATTITMTATTVTAASPPGQYYFENITNNTNSGWIATPAWQQTGLTTNQSYSYRVKARDLFNVENNWSPSSSVNLTSAGDISPPSPDGMTFATPPAALDEETITMTASTASDVNGVEYYFENITNSTNSGWQDSPIYTEINLLPLTSYTYRVRARDKSPNQNATAFSGDAAASTADLPDETPPQIVSVSPADGSLVSDLATHLVVTFDEPLTVANGTITLRNLTDSTEIDFDVSNPAVTVSGNVLTLNSPTNLVSNKNYAVQISSGAVADLSSNPFPGIIDDNTWNFTAILGDPIAHPGGPYVVPLGAPLNLNGSASAPSYLETITLYEWDINNDGTYGDATGAIPPSITDTVLMGTWGMAIGQNTIGLRVTDSSNKIATATATVKLGASLTWDANGTSANQTDGPGAWLGTNQWWESPANYSWSSGANTVFGSGGTGGTVTLASPTNINTLTFNSFSGTYTIGTTGQSIALGNGITKNIGSGAASIISPLTLSAPQSWTNHSTTLLTVGPDGLSNGGNLLTITGTGNTTVSGAISGAGGLTKSGAGTVTLSAANDYLGTTTLGSGVLVLGNNTTLGGGGFQLNGGTIQSSDSSARSLTNAVTLGGNFTVGGNGNLTFSHPGASALGATRTVTVTNGTVNATFAQAFSGTGFGIVKAGSGTLTLSGASSYTGGVTLSGGKLVAIGSGALGTGTVTMSTASTTLHFQRDSGLTISNPWSFPTRSVTQTFIVDRLTPGPSDNWTISGSFAQLSGNTLVFQKGANITNTPSVNLSGGMPTTDSNTGTIRVVGDSVNVRMNHISNTRTRVIELSGSSLANEVYGAITQNNSHVCSVTKTGTGTWLLSGNNNGTTVYSSTTVSNGLLNTTKAAALALYNSAGKVVINGGTLGVQVGGAGWTNSQVDALLAAATKTSGALGLDTSNGNLTQWTAFTTTNLGTSLGLTKLGSNTLTLDQSNTYTGTTHVSSGRLILTGAAQATRAITFAAKSSLGLVVGLPVNAANAAVNFTNGVISVSGTPSSSSHVLLTALSFTGTPTLTSPVAGYELQIIGNQLQLNQVIADPYSTWSGGAAFEADSNSDGVENGLAWILGAANPNTTASSLLPTLDGSSDPDFIIFNYRRNDTAAADANTSLKVQYGSTMEGWTDAIAGPDVIITPSDNFYAIGIDKVEVKIRRTLSVGGKLFTRLHVAVTP